MGALTDNRKRFFVDLCSPLSSSAAPAQLHNELPQEAPLKKSKFADPQHLEPARPPHSSLPRALPAEIPVKPRLQRAPDPAPLRRPVHGPQRIVRAFGRGSKVDSSGRSTPELFLRRERESVMGSAMSWFAKRANPLLEALWSSHGKVETAETPEKSGRRIGSFERLDLVEYKKLVDSAKNDRSLAAPALKHSGKTPAKISLPQSVPSRLSELTILGEEDEFSESPVSNRKIESDSRLLKIEPSPLEGTIVETKRTPLYKDLLTSARKRADKLSSLEFEVKLTEKKISEFHKVSYEKQEEDISGPFKPLTDDEERAVTLSLGDTDNFWSNKHEILVVHENSNIEITRETIQCLRQCSWLNDEVINLYFELLKERETREPDKFLRCHFFNTFFYKKLTGGRNSYDFKAVRRWTSRRKLGYGLIECDKIFVPIHKEIHWCLAIIDMKSNKFVYLDSLGGMDDLPLHVLARYIVDEVKDKSGETIDVSSWTLGTADDLPLQENGWDCGMFMVKYADFYSRGLALRFSQDDMDYFRRRTAKEILNLRAE